MKHTLLAAAFCVLFASFVFGQNEEISIIPRPNGVVRREGDFRFTRSTKIVARKQTEIRMAAILNEALFRACGFRLKIVSKAPKSDFITVGWLNVDIPSSSEEYVITVEPNKIYILSRGERGLFYAIQTFLQLLPSKVVSAASISAGEIRDSPRFKYRGMHLDVSRHFMPVEFVKKYIDLMSQYKFNYFHWHLTDDQGWRIEIKKYPRLTEIGSRRSETHVGRYTPEFKGDGVPVEGFYTQEQIKEIVKYAKARYITVVPEIELPGHASAALAAYPQFGCKADYKYEVKKTWGIFKEVFCPTDETFAFLEDVLDETIKLFPDSPYIHIGGDEVLKDHWKESPFVQELKKRENLKDEYEVQSYFIRRIEKFINAKGKKMIGWDEILEGGLAPNATVMSWRGMRGGIEAAKSKHDVIMTPTDYVYFDYGQGDPAHEPLNIGGYLPMERVYSFEPVPKELDETQAKYVIGGQANVWSEYLKTPSAVEYMAFPRMLALSEVLWSSKESRDFADFKRRLNLHLPRLDKQGVNYRIPEPDGLQNIVTENEKASIELTPAPSTRVFYTLDGSTPNEGSAVYDKPIEVGLKRGEVKTLKTIVINAAGRKSSVYAATLLSGKYREPDTATATTPGVTFSLVQPNADFAEDSQVKNGVTASFSLSQFEKQIDLKRSFSVQFDGYLRVPVDGVYELQVESTWDATLLVGSERLIDDAGTAENKLRSCVLPLRAGLHKISLRYNHRGGIANFRFRYGIKGQGLRQVYGGELVH